MKVIVKKIREEYYKEVLKGNKTFELRKEDDVYFEEGDILILEEINEGFRDLFTGRFAISRVGYVLKNYEGLLDDYAIISLRDTQFCDLTNNESLFD